MLRHLVVIFIDVLSFSMKFIKGTKSHAEEDCLVLGV